MHKHSLSPDRCRPRRHDTLRPDDVPTADKVAALRQCDTYGAAPEIITAIETHMSWVFLAGELVYKLKKPVRYAFLDFSTLRARRHDCELEVRLNRRLAPDVYLGVVPLVITSDGTLRLDENGAPADWLVKMRRLPAALMLDRAIQAGTACAQDIRRCVLTLTTFYRRCTPVPMDAGRYRARFIDGVHEHHHDLATPEYGLPPETLQRVSSAQLAFVEHNPHLFDRRVHDQRIVDGHGDLRPEHVCLSEPPVFIDCLEFNREWRFVDPVEELAYLAMECDVAGAAFVSDIAFRAYAEGSGDTPPAALIRFHKSYRAAIRAKLSAGHLRDQGDGAYRQKWRERARRYLALSGHYAASL